MGSSSLFLGFCGVWEGDRCGLIALSSFSHQAKRLKSMHVA
jgi:hypothetical protein